MVAVERRRRADLAVVDLVLQRLVLGDADGVALAATPANGGYRLDGHKSFVLDGHTADLILVLARRPGTSGDAGLSLFTVPGDAAVVGAANRQLDGIVDLVSDALLAIAPPDFPLLLSEGPFRLEEVFEASAGWLGV